MRKDNVDLICSIGELAGLFEKSTSLNDFLQTVVSIVAYHMRAAVCSIYLYDEEENDLVLRANQGLDPDYIGAVRLKLGEGLIGTSVKQLRSIREESAAENPSYKFIPGLGEEKYEAFLTVPILRGITRIGALVVQDTQRAYFDENDEKALKAIAAQLATTIENAKLFMSLHQIEGRITTRNEAGDKAEKFFKGTPASSGVAHGKAAVLGRASTNFVVDEEAQALPRTAEDFQRAVKETEKQLDELQREVENSLGDAGALIFSAHLLILKDTDFSGAMSQHIESGMSPQMAISTVVNNYITLFSQSSNSRLREKVQDVKDLGHRLLNNLLGETVIHADYEGNIIIAGELLPSDILKLSAQHAAGMVIVDRTVSSHIAVLARSMQIPIVFVREQEIFGVSDHTEIIVDAEQGSVVINPSADVVENYRELIDGQRSAAQLEDDVEDETYTTDGCRIKLMANINLLSELEVARRLKAEGIGLYRSEFPFIVRNDFPDEEEQYRIYTKIFNEMAAQDVVFRTLDIGGDKILSYFSNINESNPFLGLRAIRFSLKNKGIFHQQLRALLRAGAHRELHIMFPLISSVDDFVMAKQEVEDCCWALGEEHVAYCAKPKLGVMIELPSAIEVVEELAQEADFLCIGSNDLVQYMLAVDRTNEHISDMYVSHHPAVLRAIKKVADAAQRHGKPLSICGDMAGDEQMVKFLIGVGIKRISVAPQWIPRVQRAIAGVSMTDAVDMADHLIGMGRLTQVEEFLTQSAS